MLRRSFNILAIIALLAGFLFTGKAVAQDSTDPGSGTDKVIPLVQSPQQRAAVEKRIDQPNTKDYQRNLYRASLIRQPNAAAEAAALAKTGTDKVLVVLVEFAGEDTFTWEKGVSDWDPLNRADPNETTGTIGDCSNIITETATFKYSGPLHNQIPKPLSEADRSGTSIWTPDFNTKWFEDFMFGNGVKINYQREDGSVVNEDFTGKSVNNYYADMSDGVYNIDGKVVGWLQLPHSAMWYGNNQCPGARSGESAPKNGGNIPGAGTVRTLVQDAMTAVNAKITAGELPGFNWADYDLDGDKVVDRLWVVHSGYGEEDSTTLLNRTSYGEGIPWSHSSSGSPFVVDPVKDIKVGPYIMMPENGGIGVFAHESSHNIGADDLYAYNGGETSAGFWTIMADDWTGTPIGFQPPAADPMHLDWWGWLKPTVITDPTKVYDVAIRQASAPPTTTAADSAVNGVRIDLPTGEAPLPVQPWLGGFYWWGGKQNVMNSMMTLKTPIAVPAAPAATNLTFDLVYDIEDQWDFLWVQASDNGGTTWKTLTNANTQCTHDVGWIGELNGFPADMCAAGIGGFTNYNVNWPDPEAQTFDLSSFEGKNILLRFWYMTDWGTTYTGTFIDNVKVVSGATTILSDGAETDSGLWTFAPDWMRSNGTKPFEHSLYLQWRNTNTNGGYDSALGDSRWRYGPANTGLLVWYNNTNYTDNEVLSYMSDYPSFGPKGMMLVVDSQPDPYRYPSKVTSYPNEGANLDNRGMMRDATFTLKDTNNFIFPDNGVPTAFSGKPAVKTFHDSIGYYPGVEYVKRGPLQGNNWITRQWDASVVVPSTTAYTLKAPGFTTPATSRYGCQIYPDNYTYCYAGPSINGGNGNPGGVNGQYGWHVEVTSEASDHTWATVRIWNSQYAVDSSITSNVSKPSISAGEKATMTAAFTNIGITNTYLACSVIDTAHVEYVAGSATGSPMQLISCPTDSNAPLAVADAQSAVGGLAWYVNNASNGSVSTFTYQVQGKVFGMVNSQTSILSFTANKPIYTSLTAKPLQVGSKYYMPVVGK
jgi:immune inhibitor A